MKKTILALLLLAALTTPLAADVVLTIPEQIRVEVGGSATVGYDRIRTMAVRTDPLNNTIIVNFELFVSADSAKPPYVGVYTVKAGDPVATIRIDGLAFETGVTLTQAQVNAVVSAVLNWKNTIESSMITLDLVGGVQE